MESSLCKFPFRLFFVDCALSLFQPLLQVPPLWCFALRRCLLFSVLGSKHCCFMLFLHPWEWCHCPLALEDARDIVDLVSCWWLEMLMRSSLNMNLGLLQCRFCLTYCRCQTPMMQRVFQSDVFQKFTPGTWSGNQRSHYPFDGHFCTALSRNPRSMLPSSMGNTRSMTLKRHQKRISYWQRLRIS